MPVHSSLPPTKKRKTSNVANIERLEETLVSALLKSTSLNPLADLTSLAARLTDPQDLHKAIYALYRVFVLIIDANRLCGVVGEAEEAKVVRSWLHERLTEYTTILCGCLRNAQKGIRTSALDILFSVLKHLSESFSQSSSQPQLHVSHFRKIVCGLLLVDVCDGKLDPDVREHFMVTWLSVYDDIRWFFLRESTSILRSSQSPANSHVPGNLLTILERFTTMPTDASEVNKFWVPAFASAPQKLSIPPPQDDAEDLETEDDWRTFFDTADTSSTTLPNPPSGKGQSQRVYRLSAHQSLHSLASHRAQFTVCWMALLPHLSTSTALSTRALKYLHRGVMPHLNKPLRLMDWIGGCVDFGGSVGLLALNGLFTLMQEYNLDYPNFYTRLYAFLTRDLLHLKHRARFFRLAELFLSSSHLPATLLASFVKRLSRLSLSAPPAAIIMIIPFTYNVLKRHPACMVMIHRDANDLESDPFDAKEPSPYLTNALSSSLWELVSHRNHYHAPLATMARIFSEAFTKPGYAMEDFLDHTYSTLFETEAKRNIKKDPPLASELRRNIFPLAPEEETEVEIPGAGTDVVSELWTF